MQFLRNFYHRFFQRKNSAAQNVLNRREQLELLALQNTSTLPSIESPFNLIWTIAHDEDFDEILLFEFRSENGILLHRELASFEDYLRAKELTSLLNSKYGDRLRTIR